VTQNDQHFLELFLFLWFMSLVLKFIVWWLLVCILVVVKLSKVI